MVSPRYIRAKRTGAALVVKRLVGAVSFCLPSQERGARFVAGNLEGGLTATWRPGEKE